MKSNRKKKTQNNNGGTGFAIIKKKTKNKARIQGKYSYVKDIDRYGYAIYDDKTGERTLIENPVTGYWAMVDPEHETKCTIQDFSGMTGKSANDVYEALIKKGANLNDVKDIYNYLKKNNYYLDTYSVRFYNGRIMRFDGRITANDVLKIYCSMEIMDVMIDNIREKCNCNYDTAALIFGAQIANFKGTKKDFAEILKCKFKDIGTDVDSESVVEEYFEFALPYAYNGFKCPVSYDYDDNDVIALRSRSTNNKGSKMVEREIRQC